MKFSKVLEMNSYAKEKLFITSDWHIGEEKAVNTHSYLSNIGDNEKTEMCRKMIENLPNNSNVIFLGDAAVSRESLKTFIDIFDTPNIKSKTFILGDKEIEFLPNKKDVSLKEVKDKLEKNGWNVFDKLVTVIDGITTLIIHKPVDALNEIEDNTDMILCGHVHGIWRTQKVLKEGKQIPIINVGIDAWANQITNYDYIQHQYNAVVKGYYDQNCFINI